MDVDQDSMVEDYFNPDTMELTMQDGSSAVFGDESNVEDTETKPEPVIEPTPTPTGTTPAETSQEKELLSFMVQDAESGEQRFDPFSAADFIARKTAEGKEPEPLFTPPPPPPVQPVQVPQPGEETYEQRVGKLYNAGFEYIDYFMQQEHDYATAVTYARQQAQMDLQNYLADRKRQEEIEQIRKETDEKIARMKTVNESTELGPVSVRNLHEAAKSLGQTIEGFTQLLMKPEYGGDVISWLFQKDNAGKVYKSNEEASEAMQHWFTKFSADKQQLGFLTTLAHARASAKVLPQIIEEARKMKQGVDQGNKKANGVRPISAQQQYRSNPTNHGQQDTLSQYLGYDSSEVDQI